MKKRRLAGLMAIAIALPATGSWLPVQAQSSSPGATFGDRDINAAIVFRQYAGLRMDRPFVIGSFADQTAFSLDSYGLPLTQAETSELDRRAAVQEAFEAAFRAARAQPDSGGTYIDQAGGGMPVFLTVDDADGLPVDVVNLIPSSLPYSVRTVSHSLSELYAVQTAIDSGIPDLRKAGIDVQSTAIDIIGNSVLIGIHGNNAKVVDSLVSRFGTIVTTREEPTHTLDTCESRNNCPPLKGGIKIHRTGNPAAYCTSGWIVHINGTTTERVLTAGHCIQLNGGINAGWAHNGTQFGTAKTETWGSGANADAGLISVSVPQPQNQFYASSPDFIRGVTGWIPNASQDVGDAVCRSGARTLYRCGYIIHENVDRDVDGFTIHHQWEVSFDASPGDSGAPMFFGTDAFGIHTDSTPDDDPHGPYYGWYSPIEWLFATLGSAGVNVSLCTVPNCG